MWKKFIKTNITNSYFTTVVYCYIKGAIVTKIDMTQSKPHLVTNSSKIHNFLNSSSYINSNRSNNWTFSYFCMWKMTIPCWEDRDAESNNHKLQPLFNSKFRVITSFSLLQSSFLTYFSPMFHFYTPENVRKLLVSERFRGYRNGILS